MITANEKTMIAQASNETKFILNGHIKWSFKDDYHLVFAKMLPDSNCPMKTMKLSGKATIDDCEYNARLFISYHEDLQKWSSVICFLDCDNSVIKSFDVISIEKLD